MVDRLDAITTAFAQMRPNVMEQIVELLRKTYIEPYLPVSITHALSMARDPMTDRVTMRLKLTGDKTRVVLHTFDLERHLQDNGEIAQRLAHAAADLRTKALNSRLDEIVPANAELVAARNKAGAKLARELDLWDELD